MINLNEQQCKEEKQEDNNHMASQVQSDLLNEKNKSNISQNIKVSKPKQIIIKAIDVPKERDNNQPNQKIKKILDKESKIIPKKQEGSSYLGKTKSQRIEAYKKKQVDKNKSNISINSNLKNQPLSKVYEKSKIEQKKISSIDEKLPCAFCSQPITFQEMQSHHDSCPQAFTCQKCKDIFPIFLKEEHSNVCISYSEIKKQQSYLKHYGDNNIYEYLNDEQLQIEEFIRQHPEIDPIILRQHFLAEKQKKYEHHDIQKTSILEPQNYEYQDEQNHYYGQPEYYDNNNYYQESQGSNMKGLNDYQIDDLITDFYQKGQSQQKDQCQICTKQKIEDQIIIRLPCLHTFHKQCLVPWLEVKSTCPTCKYKLKSR